MSGDITVKDLSPDQRVAYDAIIRWVDDVPVDGGLLTLGGFAGVGKSTVVSLVAEHLPSPVAFCAYTGKASSVLKRKLQAAGIFTVGTQKAREGGGPSLETRPYCGTIHSLIYRPCECREPREVAVNKPCPEKGCGIELSWADINRVICAAGHGHETTSAKFEALKPGTKLVYPSKGPDGVCAICRGKDWIRREVLDRDYTLIIVDEASMVDSTILRDLRSYGLPILAVGDHGQLPPVGGVGELMRAPHLRLEKIHRQAEGNPIIALSRIVRETGRLPDRMPGDAVQFGSLRMVESVLEDRYADASAARMLEMAVICYTNRRRVGLNTLVRRARGLARRGNELPRLGEHVVCLRNMKSSGGRAPIYNGMRGVLVTDADFKKTRGSSGNDTGVVSEIHLEGTIEFPEDGIEARPFEMFRPQFNREKTFQDPEELQRETGINSFAKAGPLFDFGYAMTCHKMQGSQVDDLVVLAERPGPVDDDTWRRWLYTSCTRAFNKLVILR